MNTKMKNKAIVIGGDHHNTLGVIRSLGEKDIEVYAIVISGKMSHITKSKYILKSWIVDLDEDKIMDILLKEFSNEKYRPIIFPTSDFAVNVIDKNLYILNSKYITSNSNNVENKINNLMNKKIMSKIAKESGFLVPQSWEINLHNIPLKIPSDIVYPCIIKPLNSVIGTKQDIIKCIDLLEVQECLSKLKERYNSVLLQEFITKESEMGIVGCVTLKNKEIIMPGVIKKIREYPLGSGSSSFAKITNDFEYLDEKSVLSFFERINYSGIFDMEFLHANGKTYFLEVNFRNGGNGYASTKAGVNIIYLWYLESSGFDISLMKKKIDKDTKFMMDTRDFRHVLNGDLGLSKWISDLLNTGAFLFINFKDMKPWISKVFKLKK